MTLTGVKHAGMGSAGYDLNSPPPKTENHWSKRVLLRLLHGSSRNVWEMLWVMTPAWQHKELWRWKTYEFKIIIGCSDNTPKINWLNIVEYFYCLLTFCLCYEFKQFLSLVPFLNILMAGKWTNHHYARKTHTPSAGKLPTTKVLCFWLVENVTWNFRPIINRNNWELLHDNVHVTN